MSFIFNVIKFALTILSIELFSTVTVNSNVIQGNIAVVAHEEEIVMKIKLLLSILLLSLAGVVIASSLVSNNHNHEGGGFNYVVKNADILEHSGGLDQCGGHNDRKNGGYHYHQGPRC